MPDLVWLASSAALVYVLQKYMAYRKTVSGLDNLPGEFTLFNGATLWSNILPRIPGIAPGPNRAWEVKHDDATKYGCDIWCNVSAYTTTGLLNIADAAVIREITNSRTRFPKPIEQYGVLALYGTNIVITEGNEWKRFKKICAPSFSEPNNKLVWSETVQVMVDLFEKEWEGKDTIVVDNCLDLTIPIALFVIAGAGFGRRIGWGNELNKLPPGHTMTFKDAVYTVSTDITIKLVMPDRLLSLTARMRKCRQAFAELQQYMTEMIEERRQVDDKEEHHDLFTSLLTSGEDDDDVDMKLSDPEIVGNTFIFLIAGHETTAHTLCYALALLALYPEQQEKFHEHVKSVLGDGRLPVYEDYNKLDWSQAVFYEALRMFPPVNTIPKRSAEDTTLTTTNMNGEKRTIPCPAGTNLVIHTPGLHYNPKYWPDPYAFKPERFLGDWPRDAFLPFSQGPRACIGRRFAEMEGAAVLTMFISRYKVEIKEEPQFAGESFDQRRERVLMTKPGLTITPIRVPLVFKRR